MDNKPFLFASSHPDYEALHQLVFARLESMSGEVDAFATAHDTPDEVGFVVMCELLTKALAASLASVFTRTDDNGAKMLLRAAVADLVDAVNLGIEKVNQWEQEERQ